MWVTALAILFTLVATVAARLLVLAIAPSARTPASKAYSIRSCPDSSPERPARRDRFDSCGMKVGIGSTKGCPLYARRDLPDLN